MSAREFLRSRIKKGNGRLGKQAMEVGLLMKKTTADSMAKRKNTGYKRDLHGQLLSGKDCWSYFVT